MSLELRILQGKWKGRKISTPSSVRGNRQFTPSILKKSLFGRIQSVVLDGDLDLGTAYFVDLFSGSGQIGLEALSQGFQNVVFFELDRNRFFEMIACFKEISRGNSLHLANVQFSQKDSFRFFSQWKGFEEAREIVFYLDPPYIFWETIYDKVSGLIRKIQALNSAGKKVLLFVQSPATIQIQGMKNAVFGNTSLSYWYSFG